MSVIFMGEEVFVFVVKFVLLNSIFQSTDASLLIPLSNKKLIRTATIVHATSSGTAIKFCARFISPPIPKVHWERTSPIMIARQPKPTADASPLNKKGFNCG
jgi:hypothetical protein